MTSLRIVIQDFESAIANGGYGGTRYLSPESELLLLSAYQYVFDASWQNEDGYSPLTPEQQQSIDLWTARAQDELMTDALIGTVQWSMLDPDSVPDNWLLANGDVFFTSQWPKLADLLVPQWADPFLPDTWRLPNLIDAYPTGVNTASNIRTRPGANTVTLTESQMPSHTHSYIRPTVQAVTYAAPGAPATFVGTFSTVTGSAGGNQAHENRPVSQRLFPYVVAA